MANAIVKTRLGNKAELVLPKTVRDALGLKPGDELTFVIDGDQVRLAAGSYSAEDPFACFTEWASEADRKGYADL